VSPSGTLGAAYGGVMAVCDHCGTASETPEPPVTWSLSLERGQVKRFCERCTRENLRAMEGKLDQHHW
jgi:hypothetical protein